MTVKPGLLLKSTAIATMIVTSSQAIAGKAVSGENALPNFIIILIDDEGYGDAGCFGATGYTTPNLDQLASNGMRFTNYYSGSALSSPARAALMTGCYAPRVGIPNVLFPYDSTGINNKETTIAELLKQKDYATAAIGKWHLGWQQKFLPLQHGFDEFFGLPYSNDMWPVNYDGKQITKDNFGKGWKLDCPSLPLYNGNQKVEEIKTPGDMDQLTARYTERAVDFIRRKYKKSFFLYLAHSMAHVPLGVSDQFKGKSEQGMYGDVMMELDWSLGEVLKTLKELGIEDNTLVIFMSDNGPSLTFGNHAGSAGGLREGKGTPFEGGFRVPCIMKWPGVIPAGTVCNQIASSIDVLPTIAAIVKADLPAAKIDGIDVLPQWKGDFITNPRQEYFYYSGNTLNAVRLNNWKYVFPHNLSSNVGSTVGKDGWPGVTQKVYFEGGLFDLRRDPGEQYDMKDIHPEIVEVLQSMANEMRTELGDQNRKIAGKSNRAPGMAGKN
jgi:arylsulfatase A-like enzyme